MEHNDIELIEMLKPANYHLRKLYNEHVELEEELSRFERTPAYTAEQQELEKQLKKRKLRGMDTIMSILRQHRDTVN